MVKCRGPSGPTYLTLHWLGPGNDAFYLNHVKPIYDDDDDDDDADLLGGLLPVVRETVSDE